MQQKQSDPNVKVLLAIGGYSAGTYNFETISSTSANRQHFADNAVIFLRQYGFDGLDVDWEFPSASYKTHFTLFVQVSHIKTRRASSTFYLLELNMFVCVYKLIWRFVITYRSHCFDCVYKLIWRFLMVYRTHCLHFWQTLYQTFESEALATGKERLVLTAAVSGYKTQMETSYEPHLLHRWVEIYCTGWMSPNGISWWASCFFWLILFFFVFFFFTLSFDVMARKAVRKNYWFILQFTDNFIRVPVHLWKWSSNLHVVL